MASVGPNGFGAECHRQTWEVLRDIVGFGLFMTFFNNKKNIVSLCPLTVCCKCTVKLFNVSKSSIMIIINI